jgi:hypothetical protein
MTGAAVAEIVPVDALYVYPEIGCDVGVTPEIGAAVVFCAAAIERGPQSVPYPGVEEDIPFFACHCWSAVFVWSPKYPVAPAGIDIPWEIRKFCNAVTLALVCPYETAVVG